MIVLYSSSYFSDLKVNRFDWLAPWLLEKKRGYTSAYASVLFVQRDSAEDPLDDSGTVQQQLDQVTCNNVDVPGGWDLIAKWFLIRVLHSDWAVHVDQCHCCVVVKTHSVYTNIFYKTFLYPICCLLTKFRWPRFINTISKLVNPCARTPRLLSFYRFLSQLQVSGNKRFPLNNGGAVQCWVPRLREKPLMVVVKFTLVDLCISWVDVVMRGHAV